MKPLVPGLTAEDRAEIERLAERSKTVDRRRFLIDGGRVLAFVLPALATFAVPRKALGHSGSGSGSGSGSASTS